MEPYYDQQPFSLKRITKMLREAQECMLLMSAVGLVWLGFMAYQLL